MKAQYVSALTGDINNSIQCGTDTSNGIHRINALHTSFIKM
jgi:hypothetical protein